jgi:thymidine kinase
MFAQKTTELIRRIRRYQSIGYRVLVVNHSCDNRYSEGDCIASHDRMLEQAVMTDRLQEIDRQVRSGQYQVVAIDEGQFFPDLFAKVTEWADTLDVHLVVAGLDGTSERNPFGDLLKLIPHAEEVERLHALCAFCRDGTVASFSKYIAPSKTQEVQVGGAELYRPVCRAHYLNPPSLSSSVASSSVASSSVASSSVASSSASA